MKNFFNKDQWLQVVLLLVTIWIWWTANSIASKQSEIAKSQMHISNEQTRILIQQTEILERQTQISQNSLKFEQEKDWSEIARNYREKIEGLISQLTNPETIYGAIHKKIRSGELVQNMNNLNNYVDELENIGALYCGGKIKLEDLRFFSAHIKPACWNSQIYYWYQLKDWKSHKKSWIAGICKALFPNSTMMATFANPQKCPILK